MQLSKALKSFSQGNMFSCKDKISNIRFPALLINGSEDVKYAKIGREMLILSKYIKQHIVCRAGHNVHLERAAHFTELIKHYFLCSN